MGGEDPGRGVGTEELPATAVGDEELQVKLVLGDVGFWALIHRMAK
jgi:hypothetical protein